LALKSMGSEQGLYRNCVEIVCNVSVNYMGNKEIGEIGEIGE